MKKRENKTMALPRYYIPKGLESAIKDNAFAEDTNARHKFSQILKRLKNIDCLEIAECHYLQLIKLGLYLEEYQQKMDTIKQFPIEGTTIEKVADDSEEKFKIQIKDLDETNPFLNVSDSLIAHEKNKPKNERKIDYFFTVVKVGKGHVIVSGTKKFCKDYSGLKKYNVTLKFNTYWFQCCHYALTVVDSFMISSYIFPKKGPVISHGLKFHQTWFNRDVFNNPDQKQAVINIINKSSFPAPYILYGPPGTGKTSTLVEAICQSWRLSDDYILVCAPSNAACDVVTKRLLHYIPFINLYRLYSRTEEYSRIDEDIKKCCNFKDGGKIDEIEFVDSCKKIIITTLCTSLRLEKMKLPFSHLFIDEGGQATLTDVLLPFCALKFSRTFQIVISGDHHQLGPCIRSKLAEPLLGQSILEKLMKEDPYKRDAKTGYNPRYITKLIRNFRSNSKELIHVPNVLFYDNELIACNIKNLGIFPTAFYAVEGKEIKSSNSTSSYNEIEIKVVLLVVESFIGKIVGDKIIGKEDIGIVTPFRLQVLKMREELDNAGLKEVDVGTVEIFQGQEKEIIIISTVRSKTFVHDGQQHIGFLSNPKRFNVALTRAKSLLVVVGNPSVLQTNKYWRYFLRFCKENNSCKGNSFLLENEMSSSLQDFSIGKKVKKSTDLFSNTLTILRLDDGVLNISNSNVDSTHPSSCTTSAGNTNVSISSINSAPSTGLIADSMKKPISNINAGLKLKVPSSSINSSTRSLNSIRNRSVAKSSKNDINSIRNSPLNTDDLYSKTINVNPNNVYEIHCRKPVKQKKNGCLTCCVLM